MKWTIKGNEQQVLQLQHLHAPENRLPFSGWLWPSVHRRTSPIVLPSHFTSKPHPSIINPVPRSRLFSLYTQDTKFRKIYTTFVYMRSSNTLLYTSLSYTKAILSSLCATQTYLIPFLLLENEGEVCSSVCKFIMRSYSRHHYRDNK